MRPLSLLPTFSLACGLLGFTSFVLYLSHRTGDKGAQRPSLLRAWDFESTRWQDRSTSTSLAQSTSETGLSGSGRPPFRPLVVIEEDSESDSSVPVALPLCPRTMLYRFGGSRGFMSEYTAFIRAAVLAHHFRYELVIVPVPWIYGNYHELSPSSSSALLILMGTIVTLSSR